MSDTPAKTDPARPDRFPDSPVPEERSQRRKRRKRRALRIVIVSLVSVFALVAAVAVGGLLVLNHLASSIRRVPVSFAKVAVTARAAAGTAGGQGMTVLITGAGIGPTGSATASPDVSGLIMLLHINANKRAGGVVSIPPQSRVPIPGHGDSQIQNALAFGGPSLLVRTVEQLTHVQIDHYARIDFRHVADLVNAVGGVDVVLPAAATSYGYTFHAGANHVSGTEALAYARQPSLSQEGRVLRQQNLVRAVLRKIASDRLLINPVTTYHVVSALTAMLTVDSNFTNSGLASLASELRGLNSRAGTFVTAPVHTVAGHVLLDRGISRQLWQAIRHDSMAAFAKKYPSTLTPEAVP